MICANNKTGVKCIAWKTEKKEGPFCCPECDSEVILRKGKIRTHHFAHIPPVSCKYGIGESEIHYRIKKELYEYFITQDHCKSCEMERRLEGVRPDISLYIHNRPVAIEIQKSTIPIDEIRKRTEQYSKLGIAILWIIPGGYPKLLYHEKTSAFYHRIKEWELYLHALYFGRVYYYAGVNKVRAVHFETVTLRKESAEWYDSDGELMSVEGYDYKAKRLKTINALENELSIDQDFKISYRNSFYSKNWIIPQSKIYIDRKKLWW